MTVAPKILVADDDQALSRTLSWILKENGYDVFTAPGGEHLFEHLTAEQFDLLLLDIMMPKVDGLQLLQRVKADPRFKDLPVLMISSMPPEEATVRSLGLGAADFIPKPFRVRELLARVKAHLRVGRELNQARAEARSRSEMMDIMQEVTASLKPEEIYGILVRRVAQALSIARCSIIMAGPDDQTGTVVAAFENPMLHNLQVDLRRYPEIRHALRTGEVVLVRDVQTDPLYRGVRDEWENQERPIETRSAVALRFSLRQQPVGVFFLRTTSEDPPLNEHDVQFAEEVTNAAVAALERAYDLENAVLGQEQMRHLAETDPLTNCFNRRALMEKLEQEMDRAARYATMLTGMMVDIDNFKQINDTYGHLVGDRVLKQLANLLKREQRSVDIVARYGGEEFAVILPSTKLAAARALAEHVRRSIMSRDIISRSTGRNLGRFTVSFGVATMQDRDTPEGLLGRADACLYSAKCSGRNRVVSKGDPQSSPVERAAAAVA
jgi:diguanylate cyclase (GGDEF)-like protein